MSINKLRLGTAIALVRLSQPKFDGGFRYDSMRVEFGELFSSQLVINLKNNGFIRVCGHSVGNRGVKYKVTDHGYRVATELEQLMTAAMGE